MHSGSKRLEDRTSNLFRALVGIGFLNRRAEIENEDKRRKEGDN